MKGMMSTVRSPRSLRRLPHQMYPQRCRVLMFRLFR